MHLESFGNCISAAINFNNQSVIELRKHNFDGALTSARQALAQIEKTLLNQSMSADQ